MTTYKKSTDQIQVLLAHISPTLAHAFFGARRSLQGVLGDLYRRYALYILTIPKQLHSGYPQRRFIHNQVTLRQEFYNQVALKDFTFKLPFEEPSQLGYPQQKHYHSQVTLGGKFSHSGYPQKKILHNQVTLDTASSQLGYPFTFKPPFKVTAELPSTKTSHSGYPQKKTFTIRLPFHIPVTLKSHNGATLHKNVTFRLPSAKNLHIQATLGKYCHIQVTLGMESSQSGYPLLILLPPLLPFQVLQDHILATLRRKIPQGKSGGKSYSKEKGKKIPPKQKSPQNKNPAPPAKIAHLSYPREPILSPIPLRLLLNQQGRRQPQHPLP